MYAKIKPEVLDAIFKDEDTKLYSAIITNCCNCPAYIETNTKDITFHNCRLDGYREITKIDKISDHCPLPNIEELPEIEIGSKP